MNAQKLIIPAAARGAAAHSVAVLDPDGRVIISTLPSEITSGADLFKELLPADRRMFATGEGLNFDRYFFASENGEYILLTGLLETHGVVLAVVSDRPTSQSLGRSAARYGFEELASKSAAPPSEDGRAASENIIFALDLERRFSEKRAPFTTKDSAASFFNSFSSLADVHARIERTVERRSLFEGVDYKTLGLATLLVCAFAAARGCREISVSVKETDDRRSLKAELAVDLACSPPDAQAIEALFGGVFGLKCKNFHAEYIGSTLVFSLCPAVFDPDAEGLMQGGGILRAERRKNEASRRI